MAGTEVIGSYPEPSSRCLSSSSGT